MKIVVFHPLAEQELLDAFTYVAHHKRRPHYWLDRE